MMRKVLAMLPLLVVCVQRAAAAEGDLPAWSRALDAEVEAAPSPEPMRAETLMRWTIGPRLGYASSSDADKGTWLAGAQARLHIFSWLAAEGSIEGRRDEYEDGDLDVFTIPIQVSGIVYLPVEWPIKPYAVAGIGWYYTHTHFSGSLSTSDDKSEVDFGGHAGAGLEWQLTPGISINADVRFIWRSEPPRVHNDFDYYEITAGVNFSLGK